MQFRILLSFALFINISILAAQDLTSPFMDGSWQSTFSNPALLHRLDGKITIGLPGLYNNFSVDNFTYNDVVSEVNGNNVFDANKAIAAFGDRNRLKNRLDVETIGFGWRSSKLALGVSHKSSFNAVIDFPKTLAQLIWQGNAQFVGQTVDFAPYFQLNNINEFSLSAAYKITDKITLGGRAKYLIGTADLSVNKGSLALTTSDEIYQLQLNPDYTVNASGAIEYDGLDNISSSLDLGKVDLGKIGKNNGLGFDVGVHFDFDKLRLQAAALDLGSSIKWTNDVTNLSLTTTGEFEGLDVLQDLLNDTSSVDGIVDSLQAQFEPVETNNSYTTTIGGRYLVGGEYELTNQLTIGAMLHFQDFELFNEASVALSARYNIADLLTVGGIYSYRPDSPANIGVNAMASLGPVNLLLATGNVLTLINPKDSKLVDIRLGLSLSLGRDSDE